MNDAHCGSGRACLDGSCVGGLESEPNQTAEEASITQAHALGAVQPGDSDLWSLKLLEDGGHFSIQTEPEAAGACSAALVLELLGEKEQRLARVSGVCPSIGPEQAFNLPAGTYYLRVSVDSGAADYSLNIQTLGPRCGNGYVETFGREACDGGELCSTDCTPSLAIISEEVRFPTAMQVPATDMLRIDVTMRERGWIDIGTGNYLLDECPSNTTIVVEDEDFTELSRHPDGGPQQCARVVKELSPGHYFVRVDNHGGDPFEMNYVAHTWGYCGDKVLNPLAGEETDFTYSYEVGDENCKLTPDEYFDGSGCGFCQERSSSTWEWGCVVASSVSADEGGYAGANIFTALGWYVFYRRIRCGDGSDSFPQPLGQRSIICNEDARSLDANGNAIGHGGSFVLHE